jgi:hypothetical protein
VTAVFDMDYKLVRVDVEWGDSEQWAANVVRCNDDGTEEICDDVDIDDVTLRLMSSALDDAKLPTTLWVAS